MLGLGPSDLTATPSVSPYYAYNSDLTLINIRVDDSVSTSLVFSAGLPSRFTLDVVVRCPQLPHNLGDLDKRRFGLTLADDAGRGFTLYFAKTGVAISRVDNYGAATALPDTSDVTEAVATSFFTIRVAVDGGLGRAYIFVGEGVTESPALRWVVPVEQTPDTVGDVFKIFAKGTTAEPVYVELVQLRLAADLVLANYPPIADAGADRVTTVGSAVRFDGRASYDVEGVPLKYKWTCIDAPYVSTFAADTSTVTTEDDGDADGVTSFISVSPLQVPAWLAAGDVMRLRGAVYEIVSVDSGTGLLEVDTDSVPDNIAGEPGRFIRQSVLLDRSSATPTAVPDLPGLYRFRLVVNDGELDSEASEVLANITALQTPVGVEPQVSIIWKAIGDEWRLVEGRDVFEQAWIGVAQILSGKLLEAWQHHYNSSIRDAQQVFQRKWIAYRTLIAEASPSDSVISARFGGFLSDHRFEVGPATVSGLALRVEVVNTGGTFTSISTTLGTGTRAAIVSALNASLSTALGNTEITAEPSDTRDGAERLAITGRRAFRLSGSACAALGLAEGVLNELAGSSGARVTDRVYYVEGVDLVRHGVQRGDLLVLNNGESFTIDRVLSDVSDPGPNRRILLFDRTPVDSTASWAIPSVVRGGGDTDYEVEGTYPGDLAKIEIYAQASGQVSTANSYVAAQKGAQLAARLGVEVHAALLADKELRFVGVKRRKAVPLPADVLSVPTLQALIAESLGPTRLREHVDYILEPFYRAEGGRPIPMLQFADSVFIEPDLEPADVLWAETTLFDNQVHVEGLFGRLVNFLRDDAATFSKDFNYVSGVAGLLYAQQRGPTVFAMTVGAQILLGQPFAEAAGYIEEIRVNYSPRQGRILIRDADGNVPTQSDTVRAYYYTKDPADLSPTSGLAENLETGNPWVAGEYIPQFSPIGAGVGLVDIYENARWWRSGGMFEVEKFHRFACTFSLELVDLANIALLFSLLTRIKPTYTKTLLVGEFDAAEDLDIDDTAAVLVTLDPYDTLLGVLGCRYDDYRGNGVTSSLYDDGVTRFDALLDSIVDTISFEMIIEWPGGTLDFPTVWPFDLDTDVVDVDGAETGVPGTIFSLSDGMDLAAGTYQTDVAIKSGPVLPPL
jgi:hypothetical protein